MTVFRNLNKILLTEFTKDIAPEEWLPLWMTESGFRTSRQARINKKKTFRGKCEVLLLGSAYLVRMWNRRAPGPCVSPRLQCP